MKTVLSRQRDNQPSSTSDVLTKALEAADAKVPQKGRAAEFLASVLEPPLLALLERRAAILAGLTNADAGLDALAAAQLNPDARAEQSSMALKVDHLTLAALEREIAVKRRAIAMQREIVSRTRAEWSAVVCDQLAPVHRAQVRRIATAIRELSAALRDHRHLVEELEGHDVANHAHYLRPMVFPGGDMELDNESSIASWWMNDARAAGLLD
jgi:hypothetical protein